MNQTIHFKKTTLLTALFLAFVIGLGCSRVFPVLSVWWLMLSFMLVLFSYRRKNIVTLFAFCIIGLVFGIYRGGQFNSMIQIYRDNFGQNVTFTAKIQSDVEYGFQGQLRFDVSEIRFDSPYKMNVPGKIDVQGRGENALYRGDVISVSGKLMPTRGSRQAKVSFSSIKVIARNESTVEKFRRKFVAGITTALPEPSATFGLGLLIGYRASLPETTEEELKITGLTHIIAVSGYNLTIIVRAVRRLLKERSKYQQTMICLSLIVLFLLVTDFSASIVRASLVSGLSLAAWYYGRQFKPLLLLSLVAALTAGWSPLYVWSDIGWYLSFLAFFGILIVSPIIMRLVSRSDARNSQIKSIIIETTAAQILTAPLILFIFNRVSLIGLLSNVIIGPLIPLAMVLGLIAGLAGVWLPILSGFIAYPARVLLRLILELVSSLSQIPYALVSASLNVYGMVAAYVLLILVLIAASRTKQAKDSTITDNNTLI